MSRIEAMIRHSRSGTLTRRRELALAVIILVAVTGPVSIGVSSQGSERPEAASGPVAAEAARPQEPSHDAALAEATAAGYSEAETLKGCLSEPIEVLERKDIFAEPIKALFIDGQTKRVDMMLCVASSTRWQFWYWLDRLSPDFNVASIAGAGGEVRGLRASPDGKYLAVQYSAEGHASIEVVDLPALLRDKARREIGRGIDSYPGYVSIRAWNGDALQVASDVLLSHPRDGNGHLDLFSQEVFSWDFLAGSVVPLREALRDPVQYYASALTAPDAHVRRDAIVNLGRLEDQSAVPFLERTLAAETDTSARAEIPEALNRLGRAAAAQNSCLSGSRDALREENMVAEPIETLFVDGQSQPIDEMLCIVNTSRDLTSPRRGSWFRLDRASPSRKSITIQGGNGDPVDSLRPSPDGRYLAIRYLRLYQESIAYVEIVDLHALMRANLYRPIRAIHAYPDSVAIKGWNGEALEVTRETLLNPPPVPAH